MKNNSDEMIKNLEFMKTPLGKKSVLNQDEWNYVHSNRFKNVYGDWESKVKKDFLLSNNTVAELTGNEFSKIEGMSLTDQVEKYFSSFGNTVSSPFFGNVILDREGADSSLAHGMGRLKAVAYAGVKDVIENGVIIDADCNHKERGYNSFIVAAPIKINDENYICEVVLKQNLKETKFYLHEVTEQKKILERAFVTNSAQKPAHQGTILSILNKALDVNDKVICPMNENGEPNKLFIQKDMENRILKQNTKENVSLSKPINLVVTQYDDKHNPITDNNGNPVTATLHCNKGLGVALGTLVHRNAVLERDNELLRKQLNIYKTNNISQADDNSWSD